MSVTGPSVPSLPFHRLPACFSIEAAATPLTVLTRLEVATVRSGVSDVGRLVASLLVWLFPCLLTNARISVQNLHVLLSPQLEGFFASDEITSKRAIGARQ